MIRSSSSSIQHSRTDPAIEALQRQAQQHQSQGPLQNAISTRHVRLIQDLDEDDHCVNTRNGDITTTDRHDTCTLTLDKDKDEATKDLLLPRVNLIVLVVSFKDVGAVDSLRKQVSRLSSEESLLQRVAIVAWHADSHRHENPPLLQLLDALQSGKKETSRSSPITIPVFHGNPHNITSCLAIARLLLQQTKLANRQSGGTANRHCHVSPLFFSTLL
jgi:hypothetical protein